MNAPENQNISDTREHHQLRAADAANLLHPWADLSALGDESAMVIKSAKGVHVYDSNGKQYLDAIGGMWCITLGYGNEELIEAMAQQAREMVYYTPFGDMSSSPAARLAKKLAELAPGDLNRAHFTTCGSTAIDSAVRTAHYYFAAQGRPEKRHVLSRRNAYHGSTYLAASLCGKLADRTLFHYEADFVHHLASPEYDPDIATESADERLSALLEDMESEINRIGAENIACFVAEPILASGGVLVPPEGYHKATLDLCHKYDILYISDEVVTAFGRLGHFFASEVHFDILPDMIVAAKGISSGYQPLGVVMISDRIIDSIKANAPEDNPVFSNGYTYSGHPVACATAIANINIMERDNICAHVQELGPYFLSELRKLSSSPIVYTVRGHHLMACVECWTGEEAGPTERNIALAQRVDQYCEEAGVLVRPYENLCIMSPPLIVDRDDVDRIVTVMGDAIKRAQRDLDMGELD
ncbi:aminotransferase, class III family protein [Luminiphilus syltensis NOR5-1B]|uniref:Aminotransferase, class III family protein n=1 Tax=Luminiphilus syltensis NOR5-1B TaxID=565045 RepID=B8KVL5_9GAMM|nr:aminotransferase [Luminiphilus syltensis]EED36687.1 aminotransferase, class III family protein [Luminiphilus syltensis NOR5-1B]